MSSAHSNAAPPLDGIRIVDFTRVLAGPFATQTLSDLGAEVIKVEHPTDPDVFRKRQPQIAKEGVSFLALNRNKKSLVLDMADPEHKAAAIDLILKADVLVENYTSRVMRKFGLDYTSLADIHPQLIYCSISAYGRTGTKADVPGYDGIAGAEAGCIWMGSTNDTDHKISMGGLPYVDITTAMNATSAILAALYARQQRGIGQHIDISLYDTALTNLSYVGYATLATGEEPRRLPRQPVGGPAGYFSAADGQIAMIVADDRNFVSMCQAIGCSDLANDPRFQDTAGRNHHLDFINSEVEKMLATQPRSVWLEKLRAAKIPCAPVLTAGEALHSDFAGERGLVTSIPHPNAGTIPNLGSPLRFSHTKLVEPVAAPVLGQHTRDILRDILAYDDAAIERICGTGF